MPPKMVFQTPTNGLSISLAFYKKLNYSSVLIEQGALVSDGQYVLFINADRFARAGVRLYKDSWQNELEELSKLTTIHSKDGTHVFADPSGTWVYLIEGQTSWETSLEEDLLKNATKGLTGNFAGLSLECIDIQRSISIWNVLGFEKTMGGVEQGWIALQNEAKEGLSIMTANACPHLFFNPSFSFFNGKENNPILIEKMRANQVAFAEEVTHFNKEGIVDNVILRDPGGFGMFVFND